MPEIATIIVCLPSIRIISSTGVTGFKDTSAISPSLIIWLLSKTLTGMSLIKLILFRSSLSANRYSDCELEIKPMGFLESKLLTILDNSVNVRPAEDSFAESTSISTSSSVPPKTFSFSVLLMLFNCVFN